MRSDGISEESRRILRDKVSLKLMMHLMTRVELDDRSRLEKIFDYMFAPSVTNLDMAKISSCYGTYRANTYFAQAFKRRDSGKMTREEESYLLNASFRQVTEHYLDKKILKSDISWKLLEGLARSDKNHYLSENGFNGIIKNIDFSKIITLEDNDIKIGIKYKKTPAYAASKYFQEAFNRMQEDKISKKEKEYLINTDFENISEDYFKGKISFK